MSLLLYLLSVLLTGCGRPTALPGWPVAALGTAGLGNSQELLGAITGSQPWLSCSKRTGKGCHLQSESPYSSGWEKCKEEFAPRKMGGEAGARWKKRLRCGARAALAAGTSWCHLGGIAVPSCGPTGNALSLPQGQLHSQGDNMAACGAVRLSWGAAGRPASGCPVAELKQLGFFVRTRLAYLNLPLDSPNEHLA